MSERMGTTTRQMEQAPQGAIFIWAQAKSLHVPKLMAKQLGRGDLKVMAVSRFVNECRGIRTPVVVDHYVWESCTGRDIEVLLEYRDRQRARESGEVLARGV